MKNEIKRGRPLGAVNKTTQTLRNRLNLFVDRNFDDLQKEYNNLEPMQKMQMMVALLPYITPKLSAVSAELELKTKLESLSEEKLEFLINQILEDE